MCQRADQRRGSIIIKSLLRLNEGKKDILPPIHASCNFLPHPVRRNSAHFPRTVLDLIPYVLASGDDEGTTTRELG